MGMALLAYYLCRFLHIFDGKMCCFLVHFRSSTFQVTVQSRSGAFDLEAWPMRSLRRIEDAPVLQVSKEELVGSTAKNETAGRNNVI